MAKYTVCANICDGNDYIKHYDGGEFDNYEEAYKFWKEWWPNQNEVEDVVRDESKESGIPATEYDLQIGLWDEDGVSINFYSESVF